MTVGVERVCLATTLQVTDRGASNLTQEDRMISLQRLILLPGLGAGDLLAPLRLPDALRDQHLPNRDASHGIGVQIVDHLRGRQVAVLILLEQHFELPYDLRADVRAADVISEDPQSDQPQPLLVLVLEVVQLLLVERALVQAVQHRVEVLRAVFWDLDDSSVAFYHGVFERSFKHSDLFEDHVFGDGEGNFIWSNEDSYEVDGLISAQRLVLGKSRGR